nr:PREDICTED: peroxisome biogenesis factor 2-like [Bemisia tabaci]
MNHRSKFIEKRASRVTSWDAALLDEELLNILRSQVQAALKYFPPWIVNRLESKTNIILNLIIWKMSVLQSQSTFGQQMLGLKYSQETFSVHKGYALLILQMFDDFWKLNLEQISNHSPLVKQYAHWVDVTMDLIKLTNFLVFLRNGDHPTLTERLLGLKIVSVARSPRMIGYNYMTRELLWHGFIEMLGFALPLVNYQYFRKKFLQVISKPSMSATESVSFSIRSQCSFCNETPILPVHIGCSHAFCYYCLESNRMIDMKYECPVCFHSRESATRVTSKDSISEGVS